MIIPDRITATLILLAIAGAGVLIVLAVLGVRWLARGGKPLDGLGPIGQQPAPFEEEIGGEENERLIAPVDCVWCDPKSRCTDPGECGCGQHCGYDWCTAKKPVLR